ncbi:PH domain-containing protein [Sporosarcina sp. Marseille-Q4063]|uniref:PH domain-containing protein n=1 Tax=Sporosarcina sp. Marseille-Q4063 TaxID=2810514 RepID=UPI001BAFCF25|nr:PH domain-containing protein [Sporosarcina sp. Marseille-Q4063]QUW22835.1 PH domain-containing protein [Sporosarcina sp. Marseille-Q4063]
MYSQIHAPEGRLSKDAIKVWIISGVINYAIWLAVFSVLLYLDYRFSWYEWIGLVIIGFTSLIALSGIWSVFIKPFLLYKNWRYAANEEFLQLKFGAFNEEHQLVPMTKIQSVSTNQGPILRKYRLYSLTIETMGSSHRIPALPNDIAIELRNRIAHYAKIKEVDE